MKKKLVYCRYWGGGSGYGGVKGVSSKNKGYVLKVGYFLLQICTRRGNQQKTFGRDLSISSEISGIL